MYETYFDLRHKPFDLVPNPNWLFLGQSHKKILSYLDYGIRERVGFIMLTGEIGSGKTTIIKNILQRYHSDKMLLASIFNTKVDSTELIRMVNEDFGIMTGGGTKPSLLKHLNSFLINQYTRGNYPTLIIDEAQNLSVEALEEVRLLSNLESCQRKLLQIILIGQPELRRTLSLPEIVQLRQRINISCHLYPLTQQEIMQYILYRLEVAGNKNALVFKDETAHTIYKYTKGIPRLINILCDFLLLAAFAENIRSVDGCMVDDIAIELDFYEQFWGHLSNSNYSVPTNFNGCINCRKNKTNNKIGKTQDSANRKGVCVDIIRNQLESIEIKIDCLSTDFNQLFLNPELSLKPDLLPCMNLIEDGEKSGLHTDFFKKIKPIFKNLFKRLFSIP